MSNQTHRLDMRKRYIAPIDPPNERRRPLPSQLPNKALAGLPAYVRRKRSKYVPDGLGPRARALARTA